MLSTRERIDLVLLYAEHKSYTLVKRELQRKGWKTIPKYDTVLDTFDRFKQTGSVENREKIGRTSQKEERTNAVENALSSQVSSIRRL